MALQLRTFICSSAFSAWVVCARAPFASTYRRMRWDVFRTANVAHAASVIASVCRHRGTVGEASCSSWGARQSARRTWHFTCNLCNPVGLHTWFRTLRLCRRGLATLHAGGVRACIQSKYITCGLKPFIAMQRVASRLLDWSSAGVVLLRIRSMPPS